MYSLTAAVSLFKVGRPDQSNPLLGTYKFLNFISSGKKRLRLNKKGDCFLFEEEDGTEIEDDECLLEYDKGTLFVLGSEWTPRPTVPVTGSEANNVKKELEHAANFEDNEIKVDTKDRSDLKKDHGVDSSNEKNDAEDVKEGDVNRVTAEAGKYSGT